MRSKKNAYVVATEFAMTEGFWANPTGLRFNGTNAYGEPYIGATRFFFNEKKRQVTGKFEDATLYETFEAAEQAAFLLVCLDPRLADNVKPMPMKDAKREAVEGWHRRQNRDKGEKVPGLYGGTPIRPYGITSDPKPEEPKWPDEWSDEKDGDGDDNI